MFWVSRRRRLPLTIALLVGLMLLGLVIAHSRGVRPDPGAAFTGTAVVQAPDGRVVQRLSVAFTVIDAGARIGDLHLDGLPERCSPRRERGLRLATGSTPLDASGHFLLTLAILDISGRRSGGAGSPAGTPVGRLTLSGSFESGERADGAIQDRFDGPALAGCGTSGGYTARS